MKLGIYGCSDDNVELRLDGKDLEEFGAYNTTTELLFFSKRGKLALSTVFGKGGWQTLVLIPDDFDEDKDKLLPVSFAPSPVGYTFEATVDIDSEDAVIVLQDGQAKAILKNGKLRSMGAIEAERDEDRCVHGMFKSGAGACPACGA